MSETTSFSFLEKMSPVKRKRNCSDKPFLGQESYCSSSSVSVRIIIQDIKKH